MLRSADKIRTSGYIGGALLVLLIGLAVPISTGYVSWMNEEVKSLDDDTVVLADTALSTDYTVTYSYIDADDDVKKVVVSGAAVSAVGVSTATFDATTRVVGIDMSGVVLTVDPVYDDDKDFDHFITIELPETADILWEQTVSRFCAGFQLDRGAAPVVPANYTVAQSYRLVIGSGDEILDSWDLGQKTDHVDNTTGDANTNLFGDCNNVADVGDAKPDFGGDFEVEDIQSFLLGAYVQDDAKEPTPMWIKVYGVRAANADEAGDVMDFALQLYTYPEDSRTDYEAMGIIQMIMGGSALGGALLMTAAFSVPGGDIRPNVRKLKKGAF